MTITIRPIEPGDILALADLHTASWRDAYRGLLSNDYLDSHAAADRLSVWTTRLAHLPPSHYGFIADAGQMPVGFVFLQGAEDAVWGTLVDNLHVVPSFKGQGIGRLLMDAAARETVHRHSAAGVYLWVFEGNQGARRFYARLGGHDAERVLVEAPGGGTLPAWRVVWKSPADLLRASGRRDA
jgi:GNAT superfamily N-acetyltransferase